MEKFICSECEEEIDIIELSEEENICSCCFNNRVISSRWCELCEMTSNYSINNPYGSCMCS